MNRLVVTADDYGLAHEVNEAVEQAHRSGILTAASLMVSGPAASDAIARAKRIPTLRVGLHLVLVEGWPTLPPESIPHLANGAGALRNDMMRVAFELALRSSLKRQLADEIRAQFEAFRRTGLRLDHVNAHKHFQLHPIIAALIVEIGREFGMRALRIPVEPPLAREGLKGRDRAAHGVLRSWASLIRSRVRAKGLLVPDAVFGLAWTGAMTEGRLASLVKNLPDGLVEIYTHPATNSGFPGQAVGYDYSGELAALCGRQAAEALRRSEHVPGGYLDGLP